METARKDILDGEHRRLFVNVDDYEGQYKKAEIENYKPAREHDEKCEHFGHGGSDFYSMWHFIEKLKGNPDADIIEVYEAMDMFLPGMFAYRSILAGGIPMEIPNLRNKEEREKWRNDVACKDPEKAGDMLLPTCKLGTPEIPMGVYERVKSLWEEEKYAKDGYASKAFKQGEGS